nr:hypothetical protein [Streptomyces roseus]
MLRSTTTDGDKWTIPAKPAEGYIEKNIKLKTPNLVVAREVAGLDHALRNFKESPAEQRMDDAPSPPPPNPTKNPPTGQPADDAPPALAPVDTNVYTLP